MRVSKGNKKLGRIANFSTVPIKDCVNCEKCMVDCYAMKAYRMYPSVREAWQENSDEVRFDVEHGTARVYYELYKFLEGYKGTHFRFHVAGDVPNQHIFNQYVEVARLHPHVKFLLFTKNYKLRTGGLPKNFTVILSTWPGQRLPRNQTLPRAWISGDERLQETERNYFTCPGSCKECQKCWGLEDSDVVFEKH